MKCTIGHILLKDGREVESKLFNSLLNYSTGNREWAKDAYKHILEDKEPIENFKKNDQGQPDFDDVLSKYDLFWKLNQDEVYKDIKRSLGLITNGKEKTFNVDTDAHPITKKFNQENPLRHRYGVYMTKVYVGDKGYEQIKWKVQVYKKSPMANLEANKIEHNEEVNKKIRELLTKVNVSVGALNELDKRLNLNGIMDTSAATINGVTQLIRIAQGVNGEKALPEEFAHFAFEAIQDNPLANRLFNIMFNNPELVKEVLGEDFNQYNTLYNNDTTLLTKEAIGKLLAKHLVSPIKFEYQSLLNRVVNAIKTFFSNLAKKNVISNLNTLQKEADATAAKLSNKLITGDLNQLLDLYVKGLQNENSNTKLANNTGYIKEGVSELFESNPELANSVYEALGFKNKLKTTLGKELEYKDPYVPQSRLKSFKQYEVLNESGDNIGTVVVEYRGNESVILHPKLNVIGKGYGKDLYKLISSKFNVEVQEWNEGAIANSDSAKKMWASLEKEGSAKRIIDAEQGDNFRVLNYSNQITPQQKQQAVQVYSQYLDTIFPDSKVRDIVYHGTDVENLQQFDLKYFGQKDAGDRGYGIYLSRDKNIAQGYGEYLYSALVNIQNPYNVRFKDNDPSYLWNRIERNTYKQDIEKLEKDRNKWIDKVNNNDTGYAFFEQLPKNVNKESPLKFVNDRINKQISDKQERFDELVIINNSDGVINEDYEIVTKPEQIHILGSKQDIEGFKKFVNRPKLSLYSVGKQLKTTADLLNEIIDTTVIAGKIYSGGGAKGYQIQQADLLDKLQEAADTKMDLQGVSHFFNTYFLNNIQASLNKIRELRKDPEFLTNYIKSSKTLRDAKNYIDGYKELVEQARSLVEELSIEGDDSLKESISNSLKSIDDNIKNFEANYKQMVLPLIIQFYQPFLQGYEQAMSKARKGPKTIEELFELSARDIGFGDRFVNSMADNSDTISRLLDIAVKRAESTARNRGIEYTKQLQEAALNLEQAGIKDTVWMYEKNSLGNYTGEFIKPKSNAYNKLNNTQKEYYDLIINMRKEALDKLPPREQDALYTAPQIHKDWLERTKSSKSLKDGLSTVWESVKDAWVVREDDTRYGTLTNISGKKIQILPTYFINKLQDMNDLSLDVTSGMAAFMGMYAEYDEMNQVINSLELTRDFVRSRESIEYKKDKPIMQKIDYLGRKIERVVTKSQSDNRLIGRLDAFFDSNVYKQHVKDEGTFGRISENLLIKYPALLNLSVNVLTSISNVANATTMTNIEAFAKEHFTPTQLAKSDSRYATLLPEHMGQIGNRVNTSKMTLLNEMFNILQGEEQSFKNPKMREKGLVRFIKNTPLSFLQNCGEHYVQMRTALAVIDNYKLKDKNGKEVSLYDALEINAKSKYRKSLQIKEGYTKLDGTEFTENDRFQLENKIRYINKQINGAYNMADRGAIQQFALGKAAMLFRRWMPAAYMRRFGSQKYSFETGDLREGYYRTTGHFINMLFQDLKQGQFLLTTRLKELSPAEKANLKRALTEGVQFILISIASALISGGDDKDRGWLEQMSTYEILRLQTELGALFPFQTGFINSTLTITQTPLAGMTSLQKLEDMFNFTEYGDVLKSGPYKGHTKFYKYSMSVIPVARQIERTLDPDKGSDFYKK